MTSPDPPDPPEQTTVTVTGPQLDPHRTRTTSQACDESGEVIAGRYRLIEVLGEGGMGRVWLAQQIAPVSRAVALKLIRIGADSAQVLSRFDAERQALALMDHPNIAKVLDAGATEDGRPFFVMELVKGVPITEFCDTRQASLRERLALFVPVCQAIHHAHQKGVIHRDIKPSNVLVAMYDDKPVPKVIDFGIAKAAGAQLSDLALATGFAILGTPEYMSPEQAALNHLDVDTRSDVYSLGVLLYALLTGTTPVDRKRFREAALLDVLRAVRESEVPRPSTLLRTSDTLSIVSADRGIDPRQLIGLLRNELDWVVMKALEKDRTRRYDSASQLAADVENFLQNRPVQAARPGRWYAVRKFVRRNRSAVGVAIVAFALLGVFWGAQRRSEQRHREAVARGAVQRYFEADVERLPALLKEMSPLREDIDPLMREADVPPGRQLHLDLALVNVDPTTADRLESYIPRAEPREAAAIGQVLSGQASGWADRLWPRLEGKVASAERVRLAAVLAQLDSNSPRWVEVADALVDSLLSEGPYRAAEWSGIFRPVMPKLRPQLEQVMLDRAHGTLERRLIAVRLLADTVHNPRLLSQWLVDCETDVFLVLYPASAGLLVSQEDFFREITLAPGPSGRRLNACAAVLRANPNTNLDLLFRSGPDPELRAGLVHKLQALGVPAATVAARVISAGEPKAKSLWVQAMGAYGPADIPPELRESLLQHCRESFSTQSDPELRGSLEWLLRRWQQTDALVAGQSALSDPVAMRHRCEQVIESAKAGQGVLPQWFATIKGQMMVAFVRPEEFVCGLRESDRDRFPLAGSSRPMRIPRSFAIGAKPVTVAEYQQCQADYKANRHFSKQSDGPALDLCWDDAVRYCNWLSEKEGLEPVYQVDPKTMQCVPRQNALTRTGYRLPTEAEWEYACRGGTTTTRFYGSAEYAKEYVGLPYRTTSVGLTKPNPFGLFDLHGNVFNWCHDAFPGGTRSGPSPSVDLGGTESTTATVTHHILRGTSFLSDTEISRSDLRSWAPTEERYITYGFRLARTLAVHK
jgi:formylglycine-generating enzyme required for sulfatase activity